MSKTCCTVDLYSGPSVGPKSYSYVLQKVTSHDERVKLTTFEAFSSCEKDDFPLLNRPAGHGSHRSPTQRFSNGSTRSQVKGMTRMTRVNFLGSTCRPIRNFCEDVCRPTYS